jgi:tRNA(Ile)-lysidine synthase TilS/MesJ
MQIEHAHTITRICRECGEPFALTESEREFFARRDLKPPKRCRPCRRLRRELLNESKSVGRSH